MHNNSSVNFNVCMALYNLYCTSNLGTFSDKICYPGLEKLGKAHKSLVQSKRFSVMQTLKL